MKPKFSSQNINGWLAVDKQKGVSSAAVVRKLKWLLKAKKVGHAGTLDPDATGILAIALGEATKTIPYVTEALKSYEFNLVLGSSTNTDDATGKVIKSSIHRPKNKEIESITKLFTGHIKQVPPNFSAVKVAGQRAYKIAQKENINFTLSERTVLIKKISLIKRIDDDLAKMEMICGKGGYVRAIARDIGELLGCYGHADLIRRKSSGPFTLSDSLASESIFSEYRHEVEKNIAPIEIALGHLTRFECESEDVKKLQNGQNIDLPFETYTERESVLALFRLRPIAIGSCQESKFYPKKVFVY